MIKPSVGRIVWFFDELRKPNDQPLAAMITHVFHDRCVNLAIFEANGNVRVDPPTSVQLLQDDDEAPGLNWYFCQWMPFQTAQASKTSRGKNRAPKS